MYISFDHSAIKSLKVFFVCLLFFFIHMLGFKSNDPMLMGCDDHYYTVHYENTPIQRPRWLSWMRRPTGDQEVAG